MLHWTTAPSNEVNAAVQDMAISSGSEHYRHQDAASSSEPSVAPPTTPYPTAGPAPGPQPHPDASQASSASDQTVLGAHTSMPGQGQVDRSGGESSFIGASSQQLQGDSPKARWSQVSISTLYILP